MKKKQKSGSLLPKQLEGRMQRSVVFSELDKHGHMNNTRYLDWVFDLLPSAFHAQHTLRDLTICYLSEAKEGEQVDLHYKEEGGLLQVEAGRTSDSPEEKQQRVFAAQVTFDKYIL